MKPGENILILPSCALEDMHLNKLAGLTAQIIEVVKKGDHITGCWVELPAKFNGELEWFIPHSSLLC